MSRAESRRCIFPGCKRPAVPPHPLGGPQPSFCDLEEHNALTAHQARERLAGKAAGAAGEASPAPENETERDRRFSDGR
jgi:hypothetical protein